MDLVVVVSVILLLDDRLGFCPIPHNTSEREDNCEDWDGCVQEGFGFWCEGAVDLNSVREKLATVCFF